jgi:hypothetical protein
MKDKDISSDEIVERYPIIRHPLCLRFYYRALQRGVSKTDFKHVIKQLVKEVNNNAGKALLQFVV